MIKYKGIVHETLNQAPFIGAVIIAPSCNKGCKGCINEHLKTDGVFYYEEVEEIIEQVKDHIFNEGLILAGLEWTESPESMIKIVESALKNHLKVMIYTHLTEDEFKEKFPDLWGLNIWVKFGEYDECKKVEDYYSFGVKLATYNQYIKNLAGVKGWK